MSEQGSLLLMTVLFVPLGSAALLALFPDDRVTGRLNALASLLTFLAAASLFLIRPDPTQFLIVDDVNIVFIVLNTFVSFTTSVFSASYIAHELETGRLTPTYLRFYHAMYQTLMFAMNLALLANNVGLMWVAIELATLTTVLMVGLYRTHAALEAAWKYFILSSVGIALALFGTILVYLAANSVVGEGLDAMAWNVLVKNAAEFDPHMLNLAFVFLLLGYGTKVGLVPLHAWLPDAHAEGPTPISAVLSGLLLNVALFAVLRFKMVMSANPEALAPGPLMVTLGLPFSSVRVLHAVPLPRHQAHVCLFLHRTHGDHHFRLRHGRTAGKLRRTAAHVLSQPDQNRRSSFRSAISRKSRELRRCRKFAGSRSRTGARMGAGARRDGDCRPPADGYLHDRISDHHLDLCAPAGTRCRAGARLARGFGRVAAEAQRPRLRRSAW